MSNYGRGSEPLDAVLRAATVPGHPEELAGEEKALAAFRAAVPAPRRRSLLARVLTVKVLVVGAVTASTGVVLATASGVLPTREPAPGPPADPPAATQPVSVPAVPPPDRVTPTSKPTSTSKPTPTSPAGPPPTSVAGDGANPSVRPHPGPGPGEGRDDRPGGKTPPASGRPTERPETESGRPGRPNTPDSPAHGAVTAVPPNGAEPPSPGG